MRSVYVPGVSEPEMGMEAVELVEPAVSVALPVPTLVLAELRMVHASEPVGAAAPVMEPVRVIATDPPVPGRNCKAWAAGPAMVKASLMMVSAAVLVAPRNEPVTPP